MLHSFAAVVSFRMVIDKGLLRVAFCDYVATAIESGIKSLRDWIENAAPQLTVEVGAYVYSYSCCMTGEGSACGGGGGGGGE
eukprot:7232330-Ditylum_brightwellii.AAC.1